MPLRAALLCTLLVLAGCAAPETPDRDDAPTAVHVHVVDGMTGAPLAGASVAGFLPAAVPSTGEQQVRIA